MSQQNSNMAAGGGPTKRSKFMVGMDRSGEGGGPQRGSLKPPVFKKTNVKYKPKKGGL